MTIMQSGLGSISGDGLPSCDFMDEQGGMKMIVTYDMEEQPDE